MKSEYGLFPHVFDLKFYLFFALMVLAFLVAVFGFCLAIRGNLVGIALTAMSAPLLVYFIDLTDNRRIKVNNGNA